MEKLGVKGAKDFFAVHGTDLIAPEEKKKTEREKNREKANELMKDLPKLDLGLKVGPILVR